MPIIFKYHGIHHYFPCFASKLATMTLGYSGIFNENILFFDDDNSWIYRGRVDVGDFTHNKKKDTFSISCDCQPFKMALTATDEPWKWDPFCFIDGVIIDYRYIPVPAGITEINLYQSDQPVAPTFLCTQDAVLTASGDIYTLAANVLTQFDDILVGENGLTVSVQTEQDGYITIGYKRRIL